MILYFQINYNLSSGNISHLFRNERKQKQKIFQFSNCNSLYSTRKLKTDCRRLVLNLNDVIEIYRNYENFKL